ncbi:hypothetical protein PV721_20645 [Streptomyces sp. MB09-01]|uniref:hypothetical protein n=1 Tax=unclassified Streptomyces TaxID=2593676 RepID=UPI0029B591DB|nr:hypothetical protein [Streptomyces sp. MB09-01]MDX3536743.1 hypothetical protein [Streptomyces sp. MB09-01]
MSTPTQRTAVATWAPSQSGPCVRCHLLCTDSEIEAVIEAPAEGLITFRQVLTQVLGYGRADAVATRVGI